VNDKMQITYKETVVAHSR